MDVFAFVRRAGAVDGAVAVAALTRFAADLPAQNEAVLRWSARGEVSPRGALWLHLAFAGAPVVRCQRCLAAFAWAVDARVTLEVVAHEAELLDADGLLDDAAIAAPEKVLGLARFDLLAQIEDELILTVPYAPRHAVCPSAPAIAAEASPAAPASPFAALQALKARR